MNITCTQCSAEFEVTEADQQFYQDVGPTIGGKKFPIPVPDICPPCRMQRRLAFRNFFNLYHRTCDLSGKRIISMFSEDAAFPVYEIHEWWSDKWDSDKYGMDIDPGKSVFEQIAAVQNAAPRQSIFNMKSENTDYCNFSFESRNCYLIGGNVGNEDCCYGHIVWKSVDCYDNLYIYKCERCTECIDCFECYNVAYSRGCENCSDSRFLVHCTGCKDCFGCVGLKNKQYHMFNEDLGKEEYQKRMQEFKSGSHQMIAAAETKLQELMGKETVKHFHGLNCEDVTGDYLYNCKGVLDSYDAKNCEDSRYLATAESFAHSHDGNFSPNRCEWSYQLVACTGHGLICCHNVMDCSEMLYCQDCSGSKNCFGCEGLRNAQYCIFNKQYSQEEYEKLVPELIAKMQADGTWGVFFPVETSPFGYNETMAMEYFPLSQEEVESRGWNWVDEALREEQYMGPEYKLPDNIADVPDDVCDRILICSASGKPYKIIPQELKFHKDMQVPLPRLSFLERHKRRMALRNPRKLWRRECAKCNKEIQTSYAPERPETVYCESCYLESIS